MRYMPLIRQGSAPTPRDPEAWAALSTDEQQAVFADYRALNETPGVTPGSRCRIRRCRPRCGWSAARR